MPGRISSRGIQCERSSVFLLCRGTWRACDSLFSLFAARLNYVNAFPCVLLLFPRVKNYNGALTVNVRNLGLTPFGMEFKR